jgi:hypothetical protein
MHSEQFISALQKRFGTVDYSSWQGVRQPFYSRVKYPVAGSSSLTLFADTQGQSGVTKFITNMPKANSFGQAYFEIKSIHTDIWIADAKIQPTDLLDANCLSSDFLNGFVNAGVLTFSIGSRPFLQVPKPFLHMPPISTQPRVNVNGIQTLTSATNNISVLRTSPPITTLMSGRDKAFILEPALLVEPEQNFSVTIDFPTGLVPVISTGVVDDTTNPLYIGVHLDGVYIRPLQ